MVLKRAAAFAALFLFGFTVPALAQDVTLTSRDGGIELSGTLLGFDGEFYRLETDYGELTGLHRSRVLALDAVVPVVAPGNPVRSISPQDLARVFSGQVTNWQELGGVDAPISLHLPQAATGLGQAVADQVMQPVRLEIAESVVRHPLGTALSAAVMDDPFAIGIASYAEVGNTVPLVLTGDCGFALEAGRRTIKTEDYPLTAPMFLYLPARRLPQIAREFLAFTRGPTAQVVIRRAGFVDQSPEEVSIDMQGNRFANAISTAGPEISLDELQRMVRTLDGMARLTTSFRFEAGSIRLDAQDAVRRAITEAAQTEDTKRVTLDVDAFGEALPMACDDSAWGRQANRRVEVWVR